MWHGARQQRGSIKTLSISAWRKHQVRKQHQHNSVSISANNINVAAAKRKRQYQNHHRA